MKQLYQIAADALIAEMKRLNPNILSVSDYSYRFWYTLEIDGKVTVFYLKERHINEKNAIIVPFFCKKTHLVPTFSVFLTNVIV